MLGMTVFDHVNRVEMPDEVVHLLLVSHLYESQIAETDLVDHHEEVRLNQEGKYSSTVNGRVRRGTCDDG